MAEISALRVRLHDRPIGVLAHLGDDRTVFSFEQDYIADPDRPVLSLGFKDRLGELITEFRPIQTKVMPFFSNLLPEDRMRTYLAQRASVNPVREYYLLWALGLDLPGAVTVIAAEGQDELPPDHGHDDDRDRNHGDDAALRFSLAGVQLKLSAFKQARGGLSIPAKGMGGAWIVKFPSHAFAGLPENKFAMMSLARLMGIDVPAVQLVDVAGIENLPAGMGEFEGQALAVERFDRLPDGSPVHSEDFAQIFGVYPDDKYEKASYANIARVLAAEAGTDAIAEFIRRLTFNILIGNADMHLKNWSVIYPDRRHAAIAPAYDLVSTIVHLPDERAALNISRTKRFDRFSADELAHLAGKALLPEKLVLDAARHTLALFHEHWQAEKLNLPLSRAAVRSIDAHLETVPLR